MATAEQNLARFQEIANRGLQDQLSPDKRARFDEAMNRGLVTPSDPISAAGDIGSGIADIALSTATDLGEQAVQGISGLLARRLGASPQAQERVQEIAGETIPDVELGPEGQAIIDAIGQKYQDIAPEFVKEIVTDITSVLSGLSKRKGDEVQDVLQGTPLESFAPALATGVQILPDIAEAAATVATGGASAAALKGTAKGIEAAGEATGRALTPVIQEVAATGTDIFNRQSPAKQKIAQLIQEAPRAPEAAGFKLEGSAQPKSKLGRALGIGGPKVVDDIPAQEAIKQGFDKGVIATVKGASTPDKTAFRRMIQIADNIKKDALFGMRNRPSDVTGDLLMGRLKIVQNANRKAGAAIDRASTALEGVPIDVSEIGDLFIKDLKGMGINITRDAETGRLIPNFKGSDIEFAGGPKSTIRNIITRISDAAETGVDAKAVHDLKRLIDTEVTYGKSVKGLTAGPERALKDFRFSLNQAIRDISPDYANANIAYAETIEALSEFQRVAGNRMNLTGPNADKATGTLMRRLMGNAQSRITLLDAIDTIENAARKHGGDVSQLKIGGKVAKGLDSDLLTQVLFADELDSVFGPAARTSLQGQFDQTMKRTARAATSRGGAIDVGIDLAAGVVEKARGINEEGAMRAIRDLLKESK